MWTMSHLVPTCYAHGYAVAQHQDTFCYAIIHGGGYELQIRRFEWGDYLLPAKNTNYFKCDYLTCYFTCVECFTFWSVVVGGPRWLDMEGLCAQLCTMSSSQCGWPNGPILSRGSSWLTMYVVWANFRSRHYVDLRQVFSRLTYGMFHATNGKNGS
jgi:hypothetical protein